MKTYPALINTSRWFHMEKLIRAVSRTVCVQLKNQNKILKAAEVVELQSFMLFSYITHSHCTKSNKYSLTQV